MTSYIIIPTQSLQFNKYVDLPGYYHNIITDHHITNNKTSHSGIIKNIMCTSMEESR